MKNTYIFRFLLISVLIACNKQQPTVAVEGDLTQIPYNPQSFTINKPAHFPEVPVPASNPMTVEGVQLGRHLFYDPILSANKTMSCSSCHLPEKSFTDGKAVSTGIDGIAGKRSSMSLLNIAYTTEGLFWDGRVMTLEDQALLPVEDPIELHHLWPNVIENLKSHAEYPSMFRKAFGINDRAEITKELAAKALAQFERTLISSGNSIFDRFQNGETDLIQDEVLDGKLLFFDEGASLNLPDAQCFHCHGTVSLNGNQFFNNGLDPFDQIADMGLMGVTNRIADKGKFRAPTLRNIALTAPYMHDGRFQTLEDVVRHYLKEAHASPGMDPNMGLLVNSKDKFNEYHIQALVAFLHTLTDTTFTKNPMVQSPF
jgi:cytochrome c peroxidase